MTGMKANTAFQIAIFLLSFARFLKWFPETINGFCRTFWQAARPHDTIGRSCCIEPPYRH